MLVPDFKTIKSSENTMFSVLNLTEDRCEEIENLLYDMLEGKNTGAICNCGHIEGPHYDTTQAMQYLNETLKSANELFYAIYQLGFIAGQTNAIDAFKAKLANFN